MAIDLEISPTSTLSITDQIKDQIRGAVTCGTLAQGHKLPSMRTLAKGMGVSLTTVERAMRDLTMEGLVIGRPGKGVFVRTDRPDRSRNTLRMSPCRTLTRGEHEGALRRFQALAPCADVEFTDEGPDLVEVALDLLPRIANELEEIDEFVLGLYGCEHSGAEVFDPLRVGGRLFMLPVVWRHSAVLINADLFRGAGVALPSAAWTWEDSLEAARALHRPQDQVHGNAMSKNADNLLATVLQNNGSVYDTVGCCCRLAEPEALEAARYLRRLAAYGVPDGRKLDEEFNQGRVAMLFTNNWSYAALRHCAFRVRARPLPTSKRRIGILSATGFGIRRGTPARDLALKMLQALAEMETWPDHVAGAPAVPFTRSLHKADEVSGVFQDAMRNARCSLHEIEPSRRTLAHLDALQIIWPTFRMIRNERVPIPDIMAHLRDQIGTMVAQPSPLAGRCWAQCVGQGADATEGAPIGRIGR